MTKYKQRTDGEGFEVPLGTVYRLACCDCGLVHDVVWVYKRGKLGMAVRRNNRATAQKRRRLFGGCNMPFSEFIEAMEKAGWSGQSDAKYVNIRKLWERLFPCWKRLEEVEKQLDAADRTIESLT